MSRPILNIVDERVVLTLTVQDGAASAAAASAAAAAASEVETGLDRVATGEDRVQTGLDRIATAADRVQTDLDAIATNADRAQTGLDAIDTAADRVQTGLDMIATGEDATLSQAWAESPTEPAGVGTKSSLTSANESKAARDEIVAKVDFTGTVENDLLQANGAGVFVPVSENKVLRLQNVLSSIAPAQVQAWDDFQENDGETNGRTSPSGHQWLVIDRLLGDNAGAGYNGFFSVSNSQSKHSSGTQNKIQVLPITTRNGLFSQGIFSYGSGTTLPYFVFFDSVSGNNINIGFAANYILTQVVGGVATTLATVATDAVPPGSQNSTSGGTFEVTVTKLSSVSEYHIGFKLAGFISGFKSGAADFFTIMDNFTHFGFGGFRGSALNGIRIYKMWE